MSDDQDEASAMLAAYDRWSVSRGYSTPTRRTTAFYAGWVAGREYDAARLADAERAGAASDPSPERA